MGLPVVLALFSAIFWLSRQLKWRTSQKMAPVLPASTTSAVGDIGATVAIHR
jgi:hypothetical protein